MHITARDLQSVDSLTKDTFLSLQERIEAFSARNIDQTFSHSCPSFTNVTSKMLQLILCDLTYLHVSEAKAQRLQNAKYKMHLLEKYLHFLGEFPLFRYAECHDGFFEERAKPYEYISSCIHNLTPALYSKQDLVHRVVEKSPSQN